MTDFFGEILPETYGDMIIVSRDEERDDLNESLMAQARLILLRQAQKTMEELNPHGILKFEMLESRDDVLCRMPSYDEETGRQLPPLHGHGPHFHLGWKARLIPGK